MSEWCNNFVLAPKAKGKVQLCLDSARLSKVLMRLVHRGPTLNIILPKLSGVKYLTLIDESSGYHNLKSDEHLSYLTTFSCPFGRYRYMQFPFGVALAVDIFQKKIDKLFSGIWYC